MPQPSRSDEPCVVRHVIIQGIEREKNSQKRETIRWFNAKWSSLETRLEIIPGKQTLHRFRKKVQDQYGVTLTDYRIVSAFRREDIPEDFKILIDSLEAYRKQ